MKNAYTTARTYLTTLMDERVGMGIYTLPPLASMARSAGVSYVTMWKALDSLKRAGVLSARPGRGIVISAAGDTESWHSTPGERARGRKWEWLVTRIEGDILSGTYRAGAILPSRKELMARYGVCYHTLRKALTRLAGNGAVHRHKRGYRIPAVKQSTAGVTVALVTCLTAAGRPVIDFSRTNEYLRTFEDECGRRKLNTIVYPYELETGEVLFPHQRGLSSGPGDHASILGFLFLPGPSGPQVTTVLNRLYRTGRPIAILEEIGPLPRLPLPRIESGQVRLFTVATSTTAAREIARTLLRLGHRRIAYISAANRSVWSRNRLRGLREIFTEAGLADGVRACVFDQYANEYEATFLVSNAYERLCALIDEGVDRASDSCDPIGRVAD
ncbi:MAG: GntR family transcriptional regulator, partial [Chitinivibrionales bacterium]|nr:GntR family transcriptional regulator [Chitinivibrionales bacterium]